jgi:hypothetical protein
MPSAGDNSELADNEAVRPEDFFISPAPGPLGDLDRPRFDLDLVRELRASPIEDADDAEAAVALARLVHDELEAFGTEGGEEITDAGIREAIQALYAVTGRLGITDFKIPFRDFKTFRSYWIKQGASGPGGWQARRDILSSMFNPLHDALAQRETESLQSTLAHAVSPRGRTGWARVDEEIAELKRHFANAHTPQDYRNVGNDCVIVFEALSRQVYAVERHLRPGEEEPPIGNTKQRLSRFIEDAASGSDAATLRKLVRAAIEFAQEVKHRDSSSRKHAGISADSVILLANLLRRLDEDDA